MKPNIITAMMSAMAIANGDFEFPERQGAVGPAVKKEDAERVRNECRARRKRNFERRK